MAFLTNLARNIARGLYHVNGIGPIVKLEFKL